MTPLRRDGEPAGPDADLQPGTTYRVSITVEGVNASDSSLGLGPGQGSASTSFNVTTAS